MTTFVLDELTRFLLEDGKTLEEIDYIIENLPPEQLKDSEEIILEARKVSREISKKFLNGRSGKIKNDHTDGKTMYLHGNAIASHDDEHVHMTMAGWSTTTTKERLKTLMNQLPGNHGIYRKKGDDYIHSGSNWKDKSSHQPVGPRDIISVHKGTGELNITKHGTPEHTRLENFRLKPKTTVDMSKAKQGNFFESKQETEEIIEEDLSTNNLLMKFDNANRTVFGEGLVPSVRAVLKTINNVDNKETLMENIGKILRNSEFTNHKKYIEIRSILRDPVSSIFNRQE